MLNFTEQQRAAFKQALMQICPSMARTWRGKEGTFNLWECDKCGAIVKDDPARSRLGWLHQKPVQQGEN
jgi:ribosomal protein L37AE/L43A